MEKSTDTRAEQAYLPVELDSSFSGSKFRPVTWHELSFNGAELKGYGVEVRKPGTLRYKLCAVEGQAVPFRSKTDADAWCSAANKKASLMAGNLPKVFGPFDSLTESKEKAPA